MKVVLLSQKNYTVCHERMGNLLTFYKVGPDSYDYIKFFTDKLHGSHNEVGTTKYNWLARCQYNVTGWVSMWAYDMLSQ